MMNKEIKMVALNDDALESVVGGYSANDLPHTQPVDVIETLAKKEPHVYAAYIWLCKAFGIFVPDENEAYYQLTKQRETKNLEKQT